MAFRLKVELFEEGDSFSANPDFLILLVPRRAEDGHEHDQVDSIVVVVSRRQSDRRRCGLFKGSPAGWIVEARGS